MSVAIVNHRMGNMPVEILNLSKKRYVESLFTNGKSDLLRKVIDKIICHQSSTNGLKTLQPLLQE